MVHLLHDTQAILPQQPIHNNDSMTTSPGLSLKC